MVKPMPTDADEPEDDGRVQILLRSAEGPSITADPTWLDVKDEALASMRKTLAELGVDVD